MTIKKEENTNSAKEPSKHTMEAYSDLHWHNVDHINSYNIKINKVRLKYS